MAAQIRDIYRSQPRNLDMAIRRLDMARSWINKQFPVIIDHQTLEVQTVLDEVESRIDRLRLMRSGKIWIPRTMELAKLADTQAFIKRVVTELKVKRKEILGPALIELRARRKQLYRNGVRLTSAKQELECDTGKAKAIVITPEMLH